MHWYPLFLVSAPALVLAVILWVLYRWLRSPRLSSLDFQLLSVKVPKKEGEEQKDFLKDIGLSEQLFSALSSIKRPIVFELAVHNSGESIEFYVAAPRSHLDFVKRQIQGLFLDARVEEAPEYTIFHPQSENATAYLRYTQSPLLPLRTYREAEADTFASIVSTFSHLREQGDGAAIQLVLQPAEESAKKNVAHKIERLKKGEKLKAVLNDAFLSWDDIKKLIFTKSPAAEKEESKVIDDEAIKTLQLKISKPLFSVNVRLVAGSADPGRAEEMLLSISAAFSQFTAALRNSFEIVKPRLAKKLIYQYIFRDYSDEQKLLMNSEEIASIFHVPTFTTNIPRIAWLRTKEVAPPANLPTEGVVIGENNFRGDRRLVRLTPADRRRHLYIVGQTGVGKSYLMIAPMVLQDIAAGQGACVIDPHGDLVDAILERMPPERIDDVIVFDPGDLRRPLGLNMLEYNPAKPEERSFIVNELLNIFDKLYDLKTTGGPMFEYYLRNALLLAMEDAPNDPITLLDIPRIFSDTDYRNGKLARIKDQLVIDFWTREAAKATGEQGLGNMTVYIASKFASFISNDYMRPIVGQVKSAFNFRELMDGKKILLVKLAKGKIGDMNASLLGMIITGRLLMAALSRSDQASTNRPDFYLYIDEFQNFTTNSIATILSEARKYGLCLTVAHQFIAQLTDEIREAVMGNVGSLVAFRVGTPDTEVLLKQFNPEFSEKDLVSIENGQAFGKLLIDGEPARPFSFRCLPPPPGHAELRPKLEELSRLSYGRDFAEVEEEITARLRATGILS